MTRIRKMMLDELEATASPLDGLTLDSKTPAQNREPAATGGGGCHPRRRDRLSSIAA
jgi:hypothetical protein